MEQKNKQRARFKAAVIWVLALNFVLLIPGLLIQGCKDKDAQSDNQLASQTNDVAMNSGMDTNVIPAVAPSNGIPQTTVTPPPLTNPPVAQIPPTSITPPAAGNPTTYKIQQGDSFYSLHKKFNVSIKAIADANPKVDPKKLRVNQEIMIPAATTPAPSSTGATAMAGGPADSSDLYVVKPGETLTRIAKAHGTTPKAIMALNNLKSDRIKAHDKLKMPAPKTATATPAAATTFIPSARPAGASSDVTPVSSVGNLSGGTAPATIR